MLKKIIFFVLLLFIFFPKPAFAKDYSINSADIKVNINADGSANITERRTYSFDGSFSWADEWINLTPKCEGCNYYKISDIINSIYEEINLEMKEKWLEFYIDFDHNLKDFEIHVDNDKLKQVFLNLLTNAIKFTKKWWIITITRSWW